ncbi:hypothetical protein PPNSA23_29450 [Phyllobacterium phragmitis]|uniref:Uncharacterized protein n=1 Tax=Phyllobacterium phragmitis TaxID=2670329 RepID=A0ABQ0H264_9HYPH
MGFVIGGLDEIAGMEALADQPSLHVDEAGQNGVDGAVRHFLFQFIEGEISRHSCLRRIGWGGTHPVFRPGAISIGLG